MFMSRLRGCNVIQPSTSKAITSASVASITASRPSLVAAAMCHKCHKGSGISGRDPVQVTGGVDDLQCAAHQGPPTRLANERHPWVVLSRAGHKFMPQDSTEEN